MMNEPQTPLSGVAEEDPNKDKHVLAPETNDQTKAAIPPEGQEKQAEHPVVEEEAHAEKKHAAKKH
jgi:hypothetical protein